MHLTTKLRKDASAMASFSVKGVNAARYKLLLSCCFLTLWCLLARWLSL